MAKRVPIDIYCEKAIATLSKTYDGLIDYIDISSIDNVGKKITSLQTIDSKDAPSRAKQLLKKGDVIVSTVRPNLNAVAIVEDETENLMVGSTGYCVLRCKESLDARYLFNFCQSQYFIDDMSSQATGASYPAISTGIVRSSLIPWCSINEQREIAGKLNFLGRLISLRKQQLAKLDELVKARFVEMFGDFKTNPMKWPIVAFEDFAIIDGNMTTDYEKYADYPHIGIDSIEKETGNLLGYRTVKEDGVISGKYVFTSEHIIYSKIRPNLNKVALPNFVGLCSADAYPILPIKEKCNRYFLAYNMRSQFFLDYIMQFCNRTNLPKVNRKEVCGFKTPLPPIELQNAFSAFVIKADHSKFTIQQSLAQLETLKKSLMQQYFV